MFTAYLICAGIVAFGPLVYGIIVQYSREPFRQ